jgi:tetratricopeptide (TPR) repeat protein
MTNLLELALVDPPRALKLAERTISAAGDQAVLSVAHQARGIALREAGRPNEALAEIRTALRLVAPSDAERRADVRATYGITLVFAGRSRLALRQLDRAVGECTGEVLSKVLMRRAYVLSLLGRQREALVDMIAALDGIRRTANRLWEARTLNNLGHVQMALGSLAAAERSFDEAMQIFRDLGQDVEVLDALQNLGEVAFCRGDLPRALAVFDEVARVQDDVNDSRPDNAPARAGAYLAAGLTAEAVEVLAAVMRTVELPPSKRADFLLALANAQLDDGDPLSALATATQARVALHRQERDWFELRAELVQVRARIELGHTTGLAKQGRRVAERLDAEGADEAPIALTLAGSRVSGSDRSALLAAAAAYRKRPSALVRASAWLAGALERESDGDRGGALRACGRGLEALDEHRQTLGSSELRALATTHGRELATVALRHAATADARTLLRWSERWRATALAQPPVTPDEEVPVSLAALRDNGRRLAEARAEGEPTDQLEQERKRLEREVRAEHHRLAGQGQADPRLDVEQLVAEVGDAALVELVDVDGTLHVLVVSGGRVRRRVAGSTEQARELTELAGFVLRRAARGRRYEPGDLGARLQEILLGPATRLLPDGPVVVAPTARLHGTPWALLPVLAGQPFSVVPSAAQWLRARAATTSNDAKVVLLAGPGLRTGGAEVPLLAARHPDALLLDGKKATVEAAMAALDGAGLAHVAAHGHFRADSPLFSSLDMADGPLTVHDLERLRVAPHRLVLSACESGVLAPVGANELLGLASALFAIGTAGLVSSVAEVNDEATAELMVGLHDRLAQGGGLADALLAAREAASGDPTREATAAAFLALGV